MIKSMTGYGRAQAVIDGMEITTEIKAVNHRYFEFSARVPRQFGYLEEKLKSLANTLISRGKVEVYVSINMLETDSITVAINHPLAKAYYDAYTELANTYGLRSEFSVSDITRNPDVLTVCKEDEDEERIVKNVTEVMSKAIDSFITMRKTEGERLYQDLSSRCDTIIAAVDEVEKKSTETVSLYRERLEQKMRELLDNAQIDEQRLLTETAIFADKIAVDEETVRLRSHIKQFRDLIKLDEPVGRKLDFLVQEINRETNTIGSKCSNVEITKIVVDTKSEIEKIREQVQNIE